MLARDAVGRDVDDGGDLVRYLPHSPGGLVAHAVKSAVEQALTDLARAARAACRSRDCSGRSPRACRSRLRQHQPRRRRALARRASPTAARRAVAAGYRAVKLAPFDGVIAAGRRARRRSTRARATDSTACSRCATRRRRRRADGRLPLALRRVARAEALLRDIAPREAVLGRVHDLRASARLRRDRAADADSRTSAACARPAAR